MQTSDFEVKLSPGVNNARGVNVEFGQKPNVKFPSVRPESHRVYTGDEYEATPDVLHREEEELQKEIESENASKTVGIKDLQYVCGKVSNGELSLADDKNVAAILYGYAMSRGIRPGSLLNADFRREHFGEAISERQLAQRITDMVSDAARRDSLNEKKWKDAEFKAAGGDTESLDALVNYAIYGGNKENYRTGFTDTEIAAAKIASSDRIRTARIFTNAYGEKVTNAGIAVASLVQGGKSAEDIYASGVLEGMSEKDKFLALWLGDTLRAGYEPGAKELLSKPLKGFVDYIVDAGTAYYRMVTDDEESNARKVSELLAKHGGDAEKLYNDTSDYARALEVLVPYSDIGRYWNNKARFLEDVKQQAELVRQIDERRKAIKEVESFVGEDKMYNYGEAYGFALNAMETIGQGAGMLLEMGIIALSTRGVGAGARVSRIAQAVAFGTQPYFEKLDEYRAEGMKEDDAKRLAFAVGATVGLTETMGINMRFDRAVGKAIAKTKAQKELAKRLAAEAEQKGVKEATENTAKKVGAKATEEKAAAIASFKSGAARKILEAGKNLTKTYGQEILFEEALQNALSSALELSSDYWRGDGEDMFTFGGEAEEFAENMTHAMKYGMFQVLPMHTATRVLEKLDKPTAARYFGVEDDAKTGRLRPITSRVSITDATDAELSAQAYRDAIGSVKEAGITNAARNAWKPDMTAEEREKTQIKFYLSDEKVALLDSLNYHAQQAEKLGGKDLIQLEEDIKEFNKVVSTLSKEDLDEVKAALKSQAGEVVSKTGTPGVQGVESADTKFKEFTGSRYDENAEIKIVKIENPLGVNEQRDTAKIRNEILKPLLGKSVQIRSDGRIVIFESSSKDALKKRGVHRSVLTELENLISNSRYFDYRDSDGKEKHKGVNGQFIYAVPVQIGDKVYRCEIILDKKASTKPGEGSFKQQSVFPISDIKITEVAMSSGVQSAHGVETPRDETTTSVVSMKFADLMEGRKPNRPSVSFKADTRGDAEAQKIEAEAKANGTWLKAPNGKPSKLSPRQWVQVRTEAFKKWFGDWENDPKNASKVVDENGEPLVVYHQTGNEFWAFDMSIQTHSRGDSGTPIGIFVKPDDKDIGFAGKKQMALFAKVANVKRFKNREDVSVFARRNANYVEAVKQIAENDKKFSREIEEVGKQIDEVYSKWWKAGRETNIRENAEFNALQKKSSSILDKWKSENDKFGSEARSLLTQDLKAQGYDGIFIEQDAGSFGRNTETYVVFENAGVKSATDNAGTFDASNPDIRFSSSSALAPTQEMTRARVEKMNGLLSRITKTAGIKIVREGSEQIRKSAEKAQAGRDKIENNLRPLSSNGIIYGYFDPVRRELHLNKDFADFDTPIHEWTHVWWAWLKSEDSRMIERIVELMKQTKEYQRFRMEAMTDKKSVYHGLSEEELAEEVFARLTGKRGEDIMEQEGLATWTKIRRCVLDFFKKVLNTLGLSQEQIDELTFEDVQNMCLRDLLDNETLGLKGLKAKINSRSVLFDAIDNAAMDWSIEDATRKRGIRNAAVLAAAKLIKKHAKLSREEVDAKRGDLILFAQEALREEDAFFHEAVADVASTLAKMVYATRDSATEATIDEIVDSVGYASKALRTEKIFSRIYKTGVIDAELYAEAREYTEKYTRLTETGRGSKAKAIPWKELNAAFGGGKNAVALALLNQDDKDDVTADIAEIVASKLGKDAKTWDVISATRKTLADAYKRVAKTWVYSKAREKALSVADAILDADSMDEVMTAGRKAEAFLRENGEAITLKSISEKISSLLAKILKKKGATTTLSDNRKYSGVFIEKVKTIDEYFEKIAKVLRKTGKALKSGDAEQEANAFSAVEKISKDIESDIQKALKEAANLEDASPSGVAAIEGRIAALRELSSLDFTDIESMSAFLYGIIENEATDSAGKRARREAADAAVNRDAEILERAANARTNVNQYDVEQGKAKKLFSWIGSYGLGLKQHFEAATRYALGDLRKKRSSVINRINERERDANLRKEKEKHRRLTAYREFLHNEMGLTSTSDIRKFSRKLKERRESLAKFSRSGNVPLSYDQVLNLYLGLRQEHVRGRLESMSPDSRERLIEANKDANILWGQIQMLPEMERVLKEAGLLKYGDGLCALLDAEHGRLNEACSDYFGVNTMVSEDDPYYFPIRRLRKGTANPNAGGADQVNIIPSAVLPRIANTRPLDDFPSATSSFFAQVEETEHFIAYGKLSRYFIRLFSNEGFARAVSDKFGSKRLIALRKAAMDTANGQFYLPDDIGVSPLVNSSSNIVAVLALGFNIGTALKQMSSIFTFANEIGFKKTFAALTYSDDRDSRSSLLKEMMKHPLWHARYQGIESERFIKEVFESGESRAADFWRMYSRVAMSVVRFGDAVAVGTVGTGLYGATKATLMTKLNVKTGRLYTEAEARDDAMAFVMDLADKTQQAGRTANFNATQRRGNAFSRMIGQFLSSVGQMLAAELHAAQDVVATKGADRKEALKKFGTVFVNNHIIIPTLTWAAVLVVQRFFKGELPDEDDGKDLIASMLLGQFSGLFLFGGLISSSLTYSNSYRSVSFPVISLFESSGKGIYRLVGSLFDGEDGATTKALVSIARGSSALSRQLVNFTDTWIEDLDDKE